MAKESIQKQDLERVEALLSAMTIEEKAGQLTQYFYFGGVPDPVEGNSEIPKPSEMRAYVEDQMKTGGVGSVLFVRCKRVESDSKDSRGYSSPENSTTRRL